MGRGRNSIPVLKLAVIDELLLQSCRFRIGLADAVDWSEFCTTRSVKRLVERADEHSAIGLVYGALIRSPVDNIPGELLEAFRASYTRQLAHNTYVIAEATEILQRLCTIETQVIKGLALQAVYYQDTGSRPTADIDLLIHHEDLWGVVETLQPFGYYPKTDFQEKAHRYCHGTLERDGSAGVPVEVHWTLNRNFPSAAEDGLLWENTREFSLNGQIVCTLSHENQLIHAALHFAHHAMFDGFPSLLWLTDVSQLSGVDGLDWQLVVEASRRQGFSRAVYFGLALAQRMMGSSVPASVLSELAPEAGYIPILLRAGRLDALAFGESSRVFRRLLASTFQGTARKRGRYMAKYWVKPVLQAVGLRRAKSTRESGDSTDA